MRRAASGVEGHEAASPEAVRRPSAVGRLALGLKFYLGFAPSFSRLGFERRGLAERPLEADFTGQRWLVTGASGGIGEAIARGAAARGATVLAVARSRRKLDRMRAAAPVLDAIRPLVADLSRPAELEALAAGLAGAGGGLDVLVNNVGVLCNTHALTPEGHESSYATNLLGHYVLTEALLACGAFNPGALVVAMSSGGMYTEALDPARLDVTRGEGWDGVAAYARHKRAQVELTHHWNAKWSDVATFHVMHPGWVDTAGVRTALPGFRRVFRRILRTPAQGADTALWLAATRPAPLAEGIWLDRAQRPEHLSDLTRTGPAQRRALVAVLERARAGSLAVATPAAGDA